MSNAQRQASAGAGAGVDGGGAGAGAAGGPLALSLARLLQACEEGASGGSLAGPGPGHALLDGVVWWCLELDGDLASALTTYASSSVLLYDPDLPSLRQASTHPRPVGVVWCGVVWCGVARCEVHKPLR